MYSVRMRAAQGGEQAGGRHISGAERLVAASELFAATGEMLNRALNHSRGKADFIQITVEAVEAGSMLVVPALPVTTVVTADKAAGLAALTALPDSMRGAMVLCAVTGRRLDYGDRGIRVSRLDAADKRQLVAALRAQGLPTSHLPEALVLAAKVVSAPGVAAELCWSDDPEYTAGYVASAGGYIRFSRLKDYGGPVGGRVFFVKADCDLAALRKYLERQPVLVSGRPGDD